MHSIRLKYLLPLVCPLSFCCTPIQSQQLSATKTTGGIEISEAGSKVLFYQTNPKSLNGKYERANYIHPFYSLNGNILTEDFPEDHPHHRGIFWAWHQILINIKPIADGWSCENISWEVVDTNISKNKKSITLNSAVLWKSFLKNHQQVAIVKENLKIIVHSSTDQYRIIDFDITLAALVDSLKIGGSDDAKGYGGFSLRLKLPEDIKFLANNKEVIPQELAIKAGGWMDFAGSFEGENLPKSGVAVFCNPSNPGYPHPWILRKEKSMQNPAFPGRVPVELTKKGLRFQYRVVIHKSVFMHNDIEKLYHEYVETGK